MKAVSHAIASVPLAAGMHLATCSWEAVALAVCISIFIDVDHLADYVYYRRGWKGLGDFFRVCQEARLKKASVLFHAWEYPIFYVLLVAAGVAPEWLWPLVLGQAYHLAFDTVANPVKPSFYWLWRRVVSRFDFADFYRPDRWRGNRPRVEPHGAKGALELVEPDAHGDREKNTFLLCNPPPRNRFTKDPRSHK